MRKGRLIYISVVLTLQIVLILQQHYWKLRQDALNHRLDKLNLSKCAVVHEPKDGCPDGYEKEVSPRFTEKDGTKQYACVANENLKRENCTDVLMPGETEELQVPLIIVHPFEDGGKPKT